MTCQLDRRLGRVTHFIGDETGRGTIPSLESPDHSMGCARSRCCGLPRDQSSREITDMPARLFLVTSHKVLKLFHYYWLTMAGAATSAPIGGVYASECNDPQLTAKYRCRAHGFIPLLLLEGYFRINASQLRTDHRYMSSSAHHPIQP